ncbi:MULTISPECIES: MFS transporter [Kosakonia]|jgi:MHS family proline/betaine transporter-like MFS transporter|uniref:MFS transporter n=2 Tax=Kosakonia TaxID=1330547 RepID=A0A807LIX7_9ENTR|nr:MULTISPECIES: MFS transporter [Kosakonia]MDP9770390.1 MHS family proline/betaine transporter-like MFS transporter [Atlantibacter hermannii]APZ06586.1 MFS transporter [Kosakonia cowanii] [Kosakonia cowanii JCM 10956 = DSM 18146]AZI87594.1 MFS transporter [Kosakonia sp. CCTCC M2018092]MDF2624564.1 transporter [Kosakonia cowanii]MDH2913162.1 MFS transporter [Kosakonia sp. HypNH10]
MTQPVQESLDRVAADAQAGGSRKLRKVLLATGIGHFVEWFDFGLYGTLAAIIGLQFFQSSSPSVALLSSFAVFGAGFIMRPLGGLFFGSLGDRKGRQKVLATVILLTSGATFVMGLLPTYHQIGITATVLLVITRLVQGFAAGGESSGATTYLAEYAPTARRGYFTCWIDNFGFMAFVVGSGLVFLLTAALGESTMNDWGWRIPFLIAGPLGWVGLYLRRHLEDSPEFLEAMKSGQIETAPLRKAVTTAWRALLFCVGFVVIKAVGHWTLQTFMPSYLATELHFSKLNAYAITTIGLFSVAVLVPFMGYLSDKYGRKPLMLAGCAGFILLSYPAMMIMANGDVLSAVLAMVMLGAFIAAFDGACTAAMAELFPTNVRYGGLSIAYNFAVAFFGGITPWFSAWLITSTGDKFSPAFYVMGAALITFITVMRARETAGQPLKR